MVGESSVHRTCHYDLQHGNDGADRRPVLLCRPWGAEWAECQHASRKRPRSVLPAIIAVGLLLCSHSIICKLVFPEEQLSKPSIHPTPTPVPRTAWHRADMQISTKCGIPHNQRKPELPTPPNWQS